MPDEDWRRLAACRGLATNLWFPERGESCAEAKAVCAGCQVRAECAAESGDERFGIWSGLSQVERYRRFALPAG